MACPPDFCVRMFIKTPQNLTVSQELAGRFAAEKETGLAPGQNIAIIDLNGVMICIEIGLPTWYPLVVGQVVPGQVIKEQAAEVPDKSVNVSVVAFGSAPTAAHQITVAMVRGVAGGLTA